MVDFQDRFSVSSSCSAVSVLSLSAPPADRDLWAIAEKRADEILCTVQPLDVSDKSRNEIIDYIQSFIRDHLGAEVFIFGSVPLKTYLPDGDIDLTVLSPRDKEDELATQLRRFLETQSGDFDFQITGVQYITAQVKVIKCTIRNIAVDISFNQISGLCALCFLEQVDQIFQKDHLFKRSIILVKTWCYYESRVLGANTGLISTYALAILVLYIINRFYSSLSGPLAVLLKFLEYYSSFEWETYCVTVKGPVLISSLPDTMEAEYDELVLNEDFFRQCLVWYENPTKRVEANVRSFPVKHFNIMDPLKPSNNLGRSVTIGNMKRVLHAFTLGARKLRDALSIPGDTMGWKLEKFFSNALARNGKGQRQDVEEPLISFGTGRSELSDLKGDLDGYTRSLGYAKWFYSQTQYNMQYLNGSMQTPPGQDTNSYLNGSMQTPPSQDTNSWDVVQWVANTQQNVSYWNNMNSSNVSTMLHNRRKSRGTGTYIPEMSQQYYTERYRSRTSFTEDSAPSTSQLRFRKPNH